MPNERTNQFTRKKKTEKIHIQFCMSIKQTREIVKIMFIIRFVPDKKG